MPLRGAFSPVLLVLALSIACTSPRTEEVVRPTAVASSATAGTLAPTRTPRPTRTPTPQPTPFASDAPLCIASQTAGRAVYQGAGGAMVGHIILKNVSTSECVFPAQPDLAIIGGDGALLALRLLPGTPPSQPYQPVLVRPEAEARAFISWRNWCPPGKPPYQSTAFPGGGASFRVSWAGGEVLTPAMAAGPRCDLEGESPMTLVLGPFTP